MSFAPSPPTIVRSGQFDQAIATLKSVPLRDSSSLAELAYTYQVAGRKNGSGRYYVRAADLAKGQIDIQLNAAQASSTLVSLIVLKACSSAWKRSTQTITDCMPFVARSPICKVTMTMRFASTRQLSLTCLIRCRKASSIRVASRLDLYLLYRDVGDSASAQREASSARSFLQPLNLQDSTRPEFLRLRAAVEMAFDDSSSAERDLKEAISLAPSSSNIVLNYANLLWKTNRKPEAIKVYTHALDLDPGNAAALSSLGYLSRETGDHAGAEKYFEKFGNCILTITFHTSLSETCTPNAASLTSRRPATKKRMNGADQCSGIAGGINSALEGHKSRSPKTGWIEQRGNRRKSPSHAGARTLSTRSRESTSNPLISVTR